MADGTPKDLPQFGFTVGSIERVSIDFLLDCPNVFKIISAQSARGGTMNELPVESVKEEHTQEDEIDLGPVVEYLSTKNGHEIASRILTIVEDVKKSTLERNASHAKFEKWLQVGIIVLVVGATTGLIYVDKFDSTVGLLFGTLVGYMFGKK